MLERIVELDRELLLSINGATAGWADWFMPFVSNKWTGIPIYLLILWLVIKAACNGSLRKENSPAKLWRPIALAVAAVIITFALCDSLSVALFKNTVCRLRPCWDPATADIVRMLEYKGGQYGFVSSHAANLFGVALISSLIIRKQAFTLFIFLWATLVGYSRVYVGKHFPLDVICGALFGLLLSYIIYLLYKKAKCYI